MLGTVIGLVVTAGTCIGLIRDWVRHPDLAEVKASSGTSVTAR